MPVSLRPELDLAKLSKRSFFVESELSKIVLFAKVVSGLQTSWGATCSNLDYEQTFICLYFLSLDSAMTPPSFHSHSFSASVYLCT